MKLTVEKLKAKQSQMYDQTVANGFAMRDGINKKGLMNFLLGPFSDRTYNLTTTKL